MAPVNCGMAETASSAAVESAPDTRADRRACLARDLTILVGTRKVVRSVRGGRSAFLYAATRVSGAPLVFTEPLERSIVWRVIRPLTAQDGPSTPASRNVVAL
jgi:hypothetical protein